MKRVIHRRKAVIKEPKAALYEAAINAKLDELAEHKPELVIESVKDGTAYIRYTFSEQVPENIADKFELMGVTYYCKDCDYCERILNKNGSINKQTKKAYCSHHGKTIYFECVACETFFFELLANTGQREAAAELPAEIQTKLIEGEEIAADHHDDR